MSEEEKLSECCCGKTTQRTEKEYKDLVNRLNRIEGQIRGIKGMLEKDAYCVDVLTQVAAAGSALNSFARVLISNHMHSCVARDIREGRDESMDELVDILKKFM
jgi:DNA-binding FrmR family transcriptional regulator